MWVVTFGQMGFLPWRKGETSRINTGKRSGRLQNNIWAPKGEHSYGSGKMHVYTSERVVLWQKVPKLKLTFTPSI